MILFSLDTSTRAGSMAVWRDGEVAGVAGTDPRSHTERLPVEAVSWLAEQGVALTEIDVFVVVAGPGSFTGLRVGVGSAQGWALAMGKPLAAVPTLDALVASIAPGDRRGTLVVPFIDGQRGEVFYAATRDNTLVIPAAVGRPDEAIAAARAVGGDLPVVVAGDGADRHAGVCQSAGWRRVAPAMLLAEAAVRLVAEGHAHAGPPHAARPVYVRRPDAVLARERAERAR